MISVITTCYNREAYIAQAIQSVLDQTHKDFELIVWDDGSTNDSVAIALGYAARNCCIFVVAAPHQGYTAALKQQTCKDTFI